MYTSMTLPFFIIIIFWRLRNFFDIFDDVMSNCYFFLIFMYTFFLLMFLVKKKYFIYFILIFYFLFIYLFIYIFIYLFIYFLIRIPAVTPKNWCWDHIHDVAIFLIFSVLVRFWQIWWRHSYVLKAMVRKLPILKTTPLYAIW